MNGLERINGLEEIADRYDAFLVDSYGVLHDGKSLFRDAAICLRELRNANKKVILFTNTPRRSETVAGEVAGVGITAEYYDIVISAGEVAYTALEPSSGALRQSIGTTYYYIGPERSLEVARGLDLSATTDLDDAEFLLITGFAADSPTVESYEPILVEAKQRELPALCVNPDRFAIRAGSFGPCSGAIGYRYQELGGEVYFYGKPYRHIYEAAMTALPGVAPNRVIGIGDAFETDIAGARNFGLDALLVASGIHAGELQAKGEDGTQPLEELSVSYGATPTSVIWALRLPSSGQ